MNKYRSMYSYIVLKGWGGGGRGSVCVESIYRGYTLCIWPDSEPTKLLYHLKQKSRRGGGHRPINTSRQVPLLVSFTQFSLTDFLNPFLSN